ncbi:hypothetical protein DRI50_00415 [candidate division KSB1 bacterium]|nr:MAG: hypothetical protein DRI50_00415 [candidate division KSB1 bacterium]
MKNFTVFLCLFILPAFLLSAPTFQKTYGDTAKDVGYGVLELANDQYLLIGYTYSFGANGADGYLLKIDNSGNLLWQHNIDLGKDEFFRHGALTADGGILITGFTRTDENSPSDLLLVKVDSNGKLQWHKKYGGDKKDSGYDIKPTPDGNFVISGITSSFGAGGEDVWILKVNDNGDTVWTTTVGGAVNEAGRGCAVDASGNIFVSANTMLFAPDMYMIKLNPDGSSAWLESFASSGWTEGYDVCLSDGNAVFAGYGYWGNHDMLMLEMSASGDTLLMEHAGLGGDDYAFAITPTSDKGFVMVGRSTSLGGGNKGTMLKVNAAGQFQWQSAWGGDKDDMLWDVIETSDHCYLAVGFTNSFGQGKADVLVVKADTSGNTTGIENTQQTLPADFWLAQNYPNPFNPTTTISYQINGSSKQQVRLAVYDITGKLVAELVNAIQSPGKYQVRFNGQNLPSGVYVYRLTAGKFSQSKKMILLK